ncbi:hypothetical protein PI125_g23612 [Phytophthora idaei]|nr:hypothetical protein PI125_g23612 [Phytophthora idaei]KAG3127181.1 hypothetical protein PI126_g21974 [Phytophthora idaei]
MVSDTAFLTEVDGFLASCELPELPTIRTKRGKAADLPRKRTAKKNDSPNCTTADGYNQESNSYSATKDKSYYKRRKMERVHLRQQVRDMTAKLEKMQKTKEANKSSKWMAFAKYQKEERLNAEEKQRRLCAAIDTRAATIQDFFKLTQTCLGELRGVSEEEARLIERTVDTTPSGPFKRIRVDRKLQFGIRVSASHIPGSANTAADAGSRRWERAKYADMLDNLTHSWGELHYRRACRRRLLVQVIRARF